MKNNGETNVAAYENGGVHGVLCISCLQKVNFQSVSAAVNVIAAAGSGSLSHLSLVCTRQSSVCVCVFFN